MQQISPGHDLYSGLDAAAIPDELVVGSAVEGRGSSSTT
jgi:hypothetical protein